MISWTSQVFTLLLLTAGLGVAQDELMVTPPAGPVQGHYARGGSETSTFLSMVLLLYEVTEIADYSSQLFESS